MKNTKHGRILNSKSSRLDENPSAYREPRFAVSNSRVRVAAFIDGFNLYHAVNNLRRPYLKWLDLKKTILCFLNPNLHSLVAVYYFSAYAKWIPRAYGRHQCYVKALEWSGVKPVIGNFKEKLKECSNCGAEWVAHEEKESDVSLALYMLHGAYRDEYDEAFLITGDSDIAPAVRLIKTDFPEKSIKLIAPPGRPHSKELFAISDKSARIKEIHLERSLFPESIIDQDNGEIITQRPPEYVPPITT